MTAAPAAPVHHDPDLRTCAACGVRAHRAEVHKNRYGQYICKVCRANGVRAVGRQQLRRWYRRMPTALVAFLVVVVLVVVLPIAALLLLQLHSYSNAGLIEDLKDLVKSINRMGR